MYRLLPLGLLAATPAWAAAEGDISDTTLGIVMMVVGALIGVFSGARAAQQGARIGLGEGSQGVQTVQMLYIGGGVLLFVVGLLTALGIIVPATAG